MDLHERLSYYTCNERRINQTHLTFSLYTECQINTTAFPNLHINNVDVSCICVLGGGGL
jgi:hypothetical protein